MAQHNGAGNSRNNVIIGNSGDNVLEGKCGNDLLIGLAGNDTLDGGTGHDIMIGGRDNDLYVVDSTHDVVLELLPNSKLGGAADEVWSSISFSLVHLQNVENLSLLGTGDLHATGNAAKNIITGNAGDN